MLLHLLEWRLDRMLGIFRAGNETVHPWKGLYAAETGLGTPPQGQVCGVLGLL